MMRASAAVPAERDVFDRRQKLLLVFAWAATLLPLLAFGYLTWQSWELNKQVSEAQRKIASSTEHLNKLEARKVVLETELSRREADLESQREATKHYRDYAGIRIRFYRETDREVVEKALVRLGFNIDSSLGKSQLIDLKPNTIGYGNLVSQNDLRDIAIALVEAGFPLKRIAPALKQSDPKLIQIYASAQSDRECGLLGVEQIRAGSTCGPLPRQ